MGLDSYKQHRKIRPIAQDVYGISIPESIMRDLKKEIDLKQTFFKVERQYDGTITIQSGCRPPKL